MLLTNISSLIFLESFILFLNCDSSFIINILFCLLFLYKLLVDRNKNFNIIINTYAKEQTLNKEKQTSIVIDKKFIKKNKKDNNKNLKLVDQLISREEIENIANQD